jgi:hypothetical protein
MPQTVRPAKASRLGLESCFLPERKSLQVDRSCQAGLIWLKIEERAVSAYIKAMWHGFAAPPQTLLKKYFDIDLNRPPLITDAIVVLLDKLEQRYSRESANGTLIS